MSPQSTQQNSSEPPVGWLKRYAYLRFAVSAIWVAVAFTVAKNTPALAAVMLFAYPAWDALANFIDAGQSGGLGRNKSQLLNFVVSSITAVAVVIALGHSMNAVLVVFGIWASLAGILQLITGFRRWKFGGQLAMILSGAQSALVGGFFIKMASGAKPLGITDVAPYAAFGAFYFLLSAIWLTVKDARRNPGRAPA